MSIALQAWAAHLDADTVYKRLRAGWDMARALATPSREGKPKRCGWCFEKGHNVRTCSVPRGDRQ
jgi:hypothetical protein